MKNFTSVVIAFILVFIACEKKKPNTDHAMEKQDAIRYVGRDSCRICHQREYQLWQNSHHDRAMDVVNEKTVLGDFNDATFSHFGITSKFYRRDGKYFVYTEGEGGAFEQFEIAYTFGFSPLQQYLIEFPNGRFQVLGICWDTRSKSEGGQRWFHIYPDERIASDDVLYWTHVNQNWNYMCAECHSTDFNKNYYPQEDLYESTWSEIDVSCESCHGPGEQHLAWAREQEYNESVRTSITKGLPVRLKDAVESSWIFKTGQFTAEKTTPPGSTQLIETCGRCHARRSVIAEKYYHGKYLLETHRPQLLTEDLYFADGQILDEVYVYGSFLQSKMYQKGVVCSDCHEPHGLTTFAKGNALCYRCHLHEKYGSESHHFHKQESPGADCADCHMHERTYMVIDPRRDHSIRIPRPDLSDRIHSPNACNQCHQDKSINWATEYIKKWYGSSVIDKPDYGTLLFDGRAGNPSAASGLYGLIINRETPNIVRATALDLLQNYPGREALRIIELCLTENDPLIRLTAVGAAESLDRDNQARLLKPMLGDEIKVVRAEAARILAALPDYMFSYNERATLDKVINDYIEIQMVLADNPMAHLNLGVLNMYRGAYDRAEAFYRQAIRLEPNYFHAYINLADLYRQTKREDVAEKILRDAIHQFPAIPDLYYALGLAMVRQKRNQEALTLFEKAVSLRPSDAGLAYVYGVALNSDGKSEEAISVLESAVKQNPFHRDLLYALVTIHRDRGEFERALAYARQLAAVAPNDAHIRQLLQQIQALLPE
jgi:tetratricopeptide (TPR) repeat protein